jgi:predicted enzyme related to lactoylglutathione lyase
MPDSRNPHGSFIWYELLTADPDSAAAFYGEVIGWTAASAEQPGIDYRLFSAEGTPVAGHMKLPDGAEEAGMRPGWLGYIGVDDVDSAVADIESAGGKVHMPAMDLEGVGRMALVADPQGVPFYVMRGASEEASTSFDAVKAGHCSWNELSTPDQAGALDFYAGRFGWEKGEVMPMGEMGGYQFIDHGGETIGAIMTNRPDGPPPGWKFAFRVRDIEGAAARISAGGGTVHYGPAEVPNGDFVVVASDPQGAAFMAVGPRD